MQFAIDPRTSALINPDVAVYGRAYECPTCGKSVFVRALSSFSVRAAHFAHGRNVGSVDCELFHPSSYTGGQQSRGHYRSSVKIPNYAPTRAYNKVSFSKYLYLAKRGESWELFFGISIPSSSTRWAGRIHIQTKYGVASLTASNISGRHRPYAVNLTFGPQDISSEGDVDIGIASGLLNNLPVLSTSRLNIFHDRTASARLLDDAEPLSRGESYLILTHMAVHGCADVIQYEEIGRIDEAVILRISIPNELSQTEHLSLEACFGRRVIDAAPSINLLDPLPDGFFDDGTVGVSFNTEYLTFYVDHRIEELEVSFPNGVSGTNHVRVSANYLLVSFPVASSCNIYWKDRLLMSVEKAAFDRALAPLIEFVVDGSSYSFDKFALELYKFENMVVEIDCNSTLVNQFKLCYYGAKCNIDSSRRFVLKKGFSLDCGGYGYLSYFSDPEEYQFILDNSSLSDTRSQTQWQKLVEFKSDFFDRIPFYRRINESNLKSFSSSFSKARARRL